MQSRRSFVVCSLDNTLSVWQAKLVFFVHIVLKFFFMPPTLKKLMGHIAFGASVSAWVGGCVGHTFCTHCNF